MRHIQLYLSHTRCQDSQSHSCFLCSQAPQKLVWDNLLMLTHTLSFTNYTACNVSYIFILFPIRPIPRDWLQGCWTIPVLLTTQLWVITRNLGLCECVLPSALFLTIPLPFPHHHQRHLLPAGIFAISILVDLNAFQVKWSASGFGDDSELKLHVSDVLYTTYRVSDVLISSFSSSVFQFSLSSQEIILTRGAYRSHRSFLDAAKQLPNAGREIRPLRNTVCKDPSQWRVLSKRGPQFAAT